MATDWAHLAVLGGENFEDFVAACLLQRHPKGWQTKPGRGDGGIDFIRPTPEGFIIYQIKKFSGPLNSSQKSQVKNSWKRFQGAYVNKGKRIAEYHLVTAWTPTESYRNWLLDEVTTGASFDRGWQGVAFLNGLAGQYPGTYARFFEGPDPLERYVTQKAMLAAIPLSDADSTSFPEAVMKRSNDLQTLLDLSADHYFINPSIRMLPTEGQPPFPFDEPGVMHQIEAIDEHRYRIISVVPKSDQATKLDPINLKVTFAPAPDTDEAQQLKDWREWGIPFNNVTGEITQTGGPFSFTTANTGMLQIVPEPMPSRSWPKLTLERQGTPAATLDFEVTEVTRGLVGEGIRIVGESDGSLIKVEIRVNSNVAASSQSITVSGIAGTRPEEVERQLGLLVGGPTPTRYAFKAVGKTLFSAALDDVEWIRALLDLAIDLRALEQHTAEQVVFPELNTITVEQEDFVRKLSAVLRGEEQDMPWRDIHLTAGQDASPEFAKFSFPGIFVVSTDRTPFTIGNLEYHLDVPIQHNYFNPQTPPDFSYMEMRKGDVLKLSGGPESRRTMSRPASQWEGQQYIWLQ